MQTMKIHSPAAIEAAITAQIERTPIEIFGAQFLIQNIRIVNFPRRFATVEMVEIIPRDKVQS